MTNEEALRWLSDLRATLAVPCGSALSEERKSFCEAVDIALSALSRDRWISVEERLPEHSGYYIIYDGDAAHECYYCYGVDFIAISHVTHWMPLPAPPTEPKGVE